MNRILIASVAFLTAVLVMTSSKSSLHLRPDEPNAKLCLKEFELPGYPPLARQILAQGDVSARIHVLGDGAVAAVTIEHGHPLLAQPVQQALEQWKFEPPKKEFDLGLTVRFSLSGTSKEVFPRQTIRATLPRLIEINTTPPTALPPDVEPLKPKRKTK